MAVLKCKMCGGTLTVGDNDKFAQCRYCDSMQTLPNLDNGLKIKLFERATELRLACDFDQAAGVFQSITAQFPEEAEAYWGLVLCKYGIEYVDDPRDGKKVPTCHRTRQQSVLNDADYLAACDHAALAKWKYEEEAQAIDALQQKILSISRAEEPYDVFICYKESDDATRARTEDSMTAQDIYTHLIAKGYKVFFSRVTLRGKAGSEYEPYIYAALSSAKVMLVIGSKQEYFNAVWLKNEWSRYLEMMQDSGKLIIPCYAAITPEQLPRQLQGFQALDMRSITFLHDLHANIERVIGQTTAAPAAQPIVQTASSAANDVASFLRRAELFLEDSDWQSADDYCEKVLDIDPECAKAYLYKMMVEYRVIHEEDLSRVDKRLDVSKHYAKILRYGDKALVERLQQYNDAVVERIGVRNAQLQEAESKKQEVIREVAHAEKLVGSADMKCKAIQTAIDQKGQSLSRLVQNIQNLTVAHGAALSASKAKYIPLWVMLPMMVLAIVMCVGSFFICDDDDVIGFIVGAVSFVSFVIGATLFVVSYRLKKGTIGASLGILIIGVFITFFVVVIIVTNPLTALLFMWVPLSILCHLAGLGFSIVAFFGCISNKKRAKQFAVKLQQATAEYEAKVQGDEELRKLHADLQTAQAEYSSTLDDCRASIRKCYENYLRVISACHMKAEALIPEKFK